VQPSEAGQRTTGALVDRPSLRFLLRRKALGKKRGVAGERSCAGKQPCSRYEKTKAKGENGPAPIASII